jgi:hypothetical protein
VDWPAGWPNPEIYDAPPMVSPSKFGNVALLSCQWRFQRVAPSGVAQVATPGTLAASATPGIVDATRGPAAPGAGAAAPAATPATSAAPAAPAPAANPAAPGAVVPATRVEDAATSLAEVFHSFKLTPAEASATFLVTCDARFDEYFAPATFTREVTVMSAAAAMAKLRAEAFADLGGDDAHRTGGSWKSDLQPGFHPTPVPGGGADVADPQAADRGHQRAQLESVRDYLAANPNSAATVEAIDRELARQARTEKLLAGDQAKGWQAFQLQGTYLSRTEGLASGPLDLHGTVHIEAHFDSYPGDGPATTLHIRRDRFVVQIRDLSRRFEQTDFTFEGRGDAFDRALKDAFDHLAVAYPRGEIAIEAEQIRDGAVARADGSRGPETPLGPGTGKAIGFQRSTETTWKKVKETVWDPVASVVTNLGAMALMVMVPGSAVIVAPALIAYNTIPVVDHVASELERGTLTTGTFAMSVGEIALNLLPVLGEAKPFTAGWFAIETGNWGGQVALMGANAIVEGKQLQGQEVAALAKEYAQFLELKKHSLPSDPGLATAEAEIRKRATEVQSAIEAQFWAQVKSGGLMIVAGSVIHNTLPGAREALLERLRTGGVVAENRASIGGAVARGADSAGHAADDAARKVGGGEVKHVETGDPLVQKHITYRGIEFEIHFDEMSPEARRLVEELAETGSASVERISQTDLRQLSIWFGKEIGVVQTPYGKLRLILGTEDGVLKNMIRLGETFMVHTHPVAASMRGELTYDLKKAGEHVEGVIDWNGNLILFNRDGVKNPVNRFGYYDAVPEGTPIGFLNADGHIVGYAKVKATGTSDGATVVKVIP